MKITIIGNQSLLEETIMKLGKSHVYECFGNHREAAGNLGGCDLLFDFFIDENVEGTKVYRENSQMPVFCNTAKITLAELMLMGADGDQVLGFNGLPTMIDRDQLELSLPDPKQAARLKDLAANLGIRYTVVEDRVGMVTPRVVCMIINEAYFTVQEGTANRSDIDQAMKLGTNYPLGPFEWCQQIGIDNVYEVLEAVYEDTKDERYKICPLLKREYLASLQEPTQQ